MLAIYKIECTVTGMYYIGSTHYLHKRLSAHAAALRRGKHDNPKLQRAWDKYGEAAFVFSHIASPLTADTLAPLEQTLIDSALAERKAFNLNRDVLRPRLGQTLDNVTRGKIAAAKTGTKLSAAALASRRAKVEGLPNPMQGRTQSAETKALISERLKAGFAAGRAPVVNTPTEQQRQRLSERHTGNSWRLNKGKPLRGCKDGEVREWPTTIACAKDLGCDVSYPSQRVDTLKLVKGWRLEYIRA